MEMATRHEPQDTHLMLYRETSTVCSATMWLNNKDDCNQGRLSKSSQLSQALRQPFEAFGIGPFYLVDVDSDGCHVLPRYESMTFGVLACRKKPSACVASTEQILFEEGSEGGRMPDDKGASPVPVRCKFPSHISSDVALMPVDVMLVVEQLMVIKSELHRVAFPVEFAIAVLN